MREDPTLAAKQVAFWYSHDAPNRQIPAKPGTCGACKWWTPPTPLNHLGGCHNMVATLGAHLASRRDSTCKHHEPK